MPPKTKAPKKKANTHVLAEKFNPGVVLKDLYKQEWTLGAPIGQGGFGLIYLATKGLNSNVNNQNADYVIKIEPKDNGPLFCELHFYTNSGKEADLKNFIKAYRLKYLGVPRYIASGIYEHNAKQFRFLAMDRYLKDLQTVLNENNHQLDENIVLYLTRQILYSLEYIHSKGYSHADIKGANLMLKSDKEVYLVDYGLAHRFIREGSDHQVYVQKPDAKHNGTIEYTSRDAHDGVPPSRRGDLEILIYCIMHWLTGRLPWLNVLENKEEVHKQKIKNMKSPKEFIATVFEKSSVSEKIKSFVQYLIEHVNTLKYDDEPCYLKIQNKINDTLKSCGYSNEDNFSMQPANSATSGKRKKNGSVSTATGNSNFSETEEVQEVDASEISEANIVKTKRSRRNLNDAMGNDLTGKEGRADSPVVKKSKLIDQANTCSNSPADKKTKQSGEHGELTATTKKSKVTEEVLSNVARTESKLSTTKKSKISEENVKTTDSQSNNRTAKIVNHEQSNDLLKSPSIFKKKEVVNRGGGSSQDDNLNIDNDEKVRTRQFLNVPHGIALRSSPRLNKSKVASNETNGIQNHDDGENGRSDSECSIKIVKTPSKTPLKRLINTPSYNGSPLTRAKITNHINDKVESPLALNNIEKDNNILLVKRRRNVPKSTMSTQTESSYLSTAANK